jgi:hypothetical protein
MKIHLAVFESLHADKHLVKLICVFLQLFFGNAPNMIQNSIVDLIRIYRVYSALNFVPNIILSHKGKGQMKLKCKVLLQRNRLLFLSYIRRIFGAGLIPECCIRHPEFGTFFLW